MPGPTVEDRITREFERARKEYAAFDRTLDALAALRFMLSDVTEIREEVAHTDFRPRLQGIEPDAIYTPDGLVILKSPADYVIELKTSWNESDPPQAIKYAKSPAYLSSGNQLPFKSTRCVLLGYQNAPGEEKLDKLFDSWSAEDLTVDLVVLRYSLEQGPTSDRMYFSRVPYKRNGDCPKSAFGRALNSTRGVSVRVENYKGYRSRFHKTNDQIIASYAAVLWWTKYANHYLSEEQKSELAERGRLSKPLVIKLDKVDDVPLLPDVEVPLGPQDVRSALHFLREARLVAFKTRAKMYEVELKEDRFIRLPQLSPFARSSSQLDFSYKILARWAVNKITKPIRPSGHRQSHRPRHRQAAEGQTGFSFPS